MLVQLRETASEMMVCLLYRLWYRTIGVVNDGKSVNDGEEISRVVSCNVEDILLCWWMSIV